MVQAEIVVGIELGHEMLEQLGKAFIELESSRDGSSNYGILWEEINNHFLNVENSLKKRFEDLEEKGKKVEEKTSASQGLLAEREEAVTAKEQASLDCIQELKDAAVAAIAEAREKYKVATPEEADVGGNTETKVSTSVNSDLNAPLPATEEKSPDNKSGEFGEAMTADVKLLPQLKLLCEQMDAKGLLKFLYENRKNLATIREEIPIALKSATVPARLVLDSLEDFYPPDQSTSQGNVKNTTLQFLRRNCLLLMESAAPLLGIAEPGGDHPLSSETKQQAKAIADEWKPKLPAVDIDAANANTLEAQAFLQLLATFSIASEFDEDELCKLVVAISRRRQAPELCRSLGLTHKMPGVIETLINSGRQIDAVHFTHAFQLTERFLPVPLLKAYLVDSKKNAHGKSGNTEAAGVQRDLNIQELAALRAVIKCIEDYDLEADYPLDPLRKRVSQLEKIKADKKRINEANRVQAKKPRGGGVYAPWIPGAAADNRQPQSMIFDDGGLHYGGSERYPYSVPASYNYQVPPRGSYGQQGAHSLYGQQGAQSSYGQQGAQSLYGQQGTQSSYGQQGVQSSYGQQGTNSLYGPQEGAQSQRSYYYTDERGPATSNYGNYMGTGLQSSHQSYM